MVNTSYEGVEAGFQLVAVVSSADMWLKFEADRPKRSRTATSMFQRAYF
jgi:hypothetical protein